MKKYFFAIFSIFTFIIFRFSLFPALGLDFFFNLSLGIILSSTMLFGKEKGLLSALIVGSVDDFFSWMFPPGTYIFLSILLVLWVSYLLDFLFTNRSRYTFFFLSLIGSISFLVWKAILSKILFFAGWDVPLSWYSIPLWETYLLQALFTSLLIFFIFRLGEMVHLISKTSFLK